MNLDQLDLVAKWLEAGAPHTVEGQAEPVYFNMGHLQTTSSPGCGTVCCVAGAVLQFNHIKKTQRDVSEFGDDYRRAADILGLDYDKAQALFFPVHWPDGDFGISEEPRDVAKVLRHLMETGEVDWNKSKSSLLHGLGEGCE